MIVVLGAFGRTGRVVAETLNKVGSVRLVTRQAGPRRVEPAAEVVRADLADEVELGRAVKGARALYALLPDDFMAQDFHGGRRAMAENVARAIRREQISRVVLLSSSSASLGERGGNGLGADLAYFERLVLETNAAVSVLRASYFQDNVLEALPMAEHEGVYANLMPSRETAIVTIAAQDVGALAAAALLEPAPVASEIVDLVGPTYSPNRVALQLGDALGRTLSIVDVPAAGQEAMFRQWMSRDAARAMVETLACLASGRTTLDGDRVERGQTRLEQVLRAALSRRPAAPAEVQP
jgi:uncharacterized protein YbjT (DUF2867 family)